MSQKRVTCPHCRVEVFADELCEKPSSCWHRQAALESEQQYREESSYSVWSGEFDITVNPAEPEKAKRDESSL